MVRLDLPTFDDPAVQRQIEWSLPKNSQSSTAFDAVTSTLRLFTTAIQLISQLSVLINVLKDKNDGPLLASLSVAQAYLEFSKVHLPFLSNRVWAATTTNADYLKSEGLKRVVNNPAHRKEIVASGIGSYLLSGENHRHFYTDIAYQISKQSIVELFQVYLLQETFSMSFHLKHVCMMHSHCRPCYKRFFIVSLK
jgi:hypothetical protein